MPQSLYFILGDLFANVVIGAVAALCCAWFIQPGWPMFPAMILAMIMGMVVSMLLALLVLVRFFGAMEVMLPTMVTGMWAGMVVGMMAAMHPVDAVASCVYGALTGVVVICLCWALNSKMRGVVTQ